MSLAPLVLALSAVIAATSVDDTEVIRTTEQHRLAALVRGDLATARQMHAEDFQLISPFGDALSREDYLGGLAAGGFAYVLWEPGPIAVRRQGDSAIVRYQARAVVAVRGKPGPEHRYWHTDYYERRDGRWQVVWSQATQIEDAVPTPPT